MCSLPVGDSILSRGILASLKVGEGVWTKDKKIEKLREVIRRTSG